MGDTTAEKREIASETLDKHLKFIRDLIIEDAIRSSLEGKPEGTRSLSDPLPKEQDIWRAALKYAPGQPFNSATTDSAETRRATFIDKLFSASWTNTAVLASLALIFGLLGLVGVGLIPSGNPEAAKQLSPFLDIAKIFAGAIVGAASATAVASASRRNP